jgi:hypothetical protein
LHIILAGEADLSISGGAKPMMTMEAVESNTISTSLLSTHFIMKWREERGTIKGNECGVT